MEYLVSENFVRRWLIVTLPKQAASNKLNGYNQEHPRNAVLVESKLSNIYDYDP